MNTVDEEPHPEDSVDFLRTTKLYECDYSSGEDNADALIEKDIAKLEPLNMPIKIGNISTTLFVNSGSPCSIPNRSLAKQEVKSSPHAVWIHEKASPQLRTFSNEQIHIEGKKLQRATDGNRIWQLSPSLRTVSILPSVEIYSIIWV